MKKALPILGIIVLAFSVLFTACDGIDTGMGNNTPNTGINNQDGNTEARNNQTENNNERNNQAERDIGDAITGIGEDISEGVDEGIERGSDAIGEITENITGDNSSATSTIMDDGQTDAQ